MPTSKPRPVRLDTVPRKHVYSPSGEPLADGPRCATCGDLAAWGTHPGCGYERPGGQPVWRGERRAGASLMVHA